ncbi:MAG: methylmalonyl Co-A mutase-associated GTPase MeaB [Verrucomicrobiota bacterium]
MSANQEPLTARQYADGILAGNRTLLARAITVIESRNPQHLALAEEILALILPFSGKCIRLGITGVPGVGKSTFIETFGCMLCDLGHRVAVLAIDPTSMLTKGSILGDKTRMENLSNQPNAFIRPSPSKGALGGVAQKTREAIFLCEAAGFDVVIVETIGVGQSETSVRSMVDFFLLLLLAGGGDELQGIKRGVMELADAFVVTKADGDNQKRAELTRSDHANALRYLQPITPGWTAPAMLCSSKEKTGIQEIWNTIEKFRHTVEASGFLIKRRQQQLIEWMRFLAEEQLLSDFYSTVKQPWAELEKNILAGQIPTAAVIRELLKVYKSSAPLIPLDSR